MQTIMIAGTIGKDAEIRTTGNGDKVAGFTVSVSNGKDANGGWRDSTWYDCSIWGKRAESLGPILKKRGKVTVTGRPTVRVHDGKAYLGISVDQVTLQGGGQSGEREPQGGYDAGPAQGNSYQAPSRDLEDEIPFAPEWRG